MLTSSNAAALATEAIASFLEYPRTFSGRGIVTCGGGIKYGACVWVLINLLRHHGCNLPIEVWCLNDDEFDPQFADLVRPLGVTCVNAAQIAQLHPHPRLRGWELKPYAIMHSRFQEILFLDADNVPVSDPSFLFDSEEFRSTGTVFWPDPEHFYTPRSSPCWGIFGTPYRPCPDQESGQLMVDKERCWKALQLCNWYNERSDFFYQHVYGDKETFRYAWQRLGLPISWPSRFASEDVRFTLCQHDFAGRVLFQHRFYRKWSLYGQNLMTPGFQLEGLCLQFLDELREKWHPQHHLMRYLMTEDRDLMGTIGGRRYLYERPGHNHWPIQLGEDSFVCEGFGPNEFFWWCEGGHLVFVGTDGKRKSFLSPTTNGHWTGYRVDAERMVVNVIALAAPQQSVA